MLGEKRSGDIFGPGPKRETGGQEAMAGEAVNSPKVEPQNEHELRQKKEQVVIPERLKKRPENGCSFRNRRFPAPTTCSFPHREKAGSLRMF